LYVMTSVTNSAIALRIDRIRKISLTVGFIL
jgi:protein gp37